MDNLIKSLMQEYQRLMKIQEDHVRDAFHDDEDGYCGNEKGVPKAKFERVGIEIRQAMIEYEKNIINYH